MGQLTNIQDFLEKILKERYGKDVRQSIHDAIQQCYYDGKAGSIDLQARQDIENISRQITDANNVIQSLDDTKLNKTGDSSDNTVTFNSGDSTSPTGWADIVAVASGETHASLFRKFSLAVKNLRYIYNMLGTADISTIGDGTVTGAITGLNNNFDNVSNYKDRVGLINCYENKDHAVGISIENINNITSPIIVIDDAYFHLTPFLNTTGHDCRLIRTELDITSNPWKMEYTFYIDGSLYSQYISFDS